MASKIKNREEWSTLVNRTISTCLRCELSTMKGNRPVPPWGTVPNDVMIVGEAPGDDEVVQGRAFVGKAGILLRNAMVAADLDPESFYWANTVMCRPLPAPPNSPQPHHVQACAVNLKRAIEVCEPKVVLLVGGFAMKKIVPDGKITKLSGKVLRGKDRIWMPVVHPSWVLRNRSEENEEMFRSHIRRFARLLEKEGIA